MVSVQRKTPRHKKRKLPVKHTAPASMGPQPDPDADLFCANCGARLRDREAGLCGRCIRAIQYPHRRGWV